MQLAWQVARKGAGQTWKNPLVGAVLVKDDQILATGYHHRFGEKHAEVDALNQLSTLTQAHGATMYVTLEPCSHYGKTPPCAHKLVEVGVRRVVIGQRDPNPLVAGKGMEILSAAGIEIDCLGDTGGLNDTYNFFYRQKRPFVTLKYAMTLDGKTNGMKGQRSLLTGKKAYYDSQHLRRQNQAILVGEQTLKIDDPELTIRENVVDFPPLRVVVVNDADQIDHQSRLFATATPILILSRHETKQHWPDFVTVLASHRWEPNEIMKILYLRGVQSLLIEGGSHVQAKFLAAGLVDALVIYVAPLIFGSGLPAITGLDNVITQGFKLVKRQFLDGDTRFDLRRIANVYRYHTNDRASDQFRKN
ncbi:bifunctional diaminohydroxyphosphoribosylaminopyrimidine deaminase/5-amino-6-(5-phosphoribosylamino)uracil reductase RibD [Lactobacillus sp. CC-MHH1034]|nr:bifunctional diaminohydroxyphosphoribosylaminopyrimidine deaminase/5-amino-6-(5-phosphoribosylamino)uracil reductase RibD [Agrilactobacillus fermenti]